MRILFLTTDFPTPWEPGRAPFNLALVRALRRNNHVRVIASVPWIKRLRRPLISNTSIGIELDVDHPTYFYPPKIARWRYDWFYWQSIRRVVHRCIRARRPDVVLAYWAHPDGAAAVRAARECGAKSAIIVGGSDVLVITHDKMRRAAVIEALSGADYIFAISAHLKKAIVDLGIDPSKIHIYRQGVEKSVFHRGDRAQARLKVGIAPRTKAILWVGRMVPVKSLDVLLKAMVTVREKCPEAKLYLVGDGPLRRSLEWQAMRLHLGDAVNFVGSVRSTQLAEWYRAANLTVLPSQSEGLPNVLRESLACGTPFVASRVGGIPEIAREKFDRLVDPGKPRALAEALIQTLPDSIDEPPAPEFLTWDQSADSLVKILDSKPKLSISGSVRNRAIDDLADSLAHAHT